MERARLIIAASEHDADMLYVSGMFVPDAFVAIALPQEDAWHGLFSPLEVDRARRESRFAQVHAAEAWEERARALELGRGLVAQAMAFLRAHGCEAVEVPGSFPLRYADAMRERGFHVRAVEGEMFPQRACKRDDEVEALARAEALTRQAMAQAERFLAECAIDNARRLRHPQSGEVVHARDVRRVIECWLIGEGAMPSHTIVACGIEGADPHCVGHGPILADQPIIIDIFPRLSSHGYWGDMTRTYVRGKASPFVKRMYAAVRDAQRIGLDMLGDGVDGARIHQRILEYFTEQGFPTGVEDGRQCGFFHGTGHGVGLEIHEAPRIAKVAQILRAGHVVTVEPGLYYPRIGGVRLEDLCLVTEDGHRNLTQYPCQLEID